MVMSYVAENETDRNVDLPVYQATVNTAQIHDSTIAISPSPTLLPKELYSKRNGLPQFIQSCQNNKEGAHADNHGHGHGSKNQLFSERIVNENQIKDEFGTALAAGRKPSRLSHAAHADK